jgi:GH25 family lysozyme M1 (1,4-beta-N-acetylmuramidase)
MVFLMLGPSYGACMARCLCGTTAAVLFVLSGGVPSLQAAALNLDNDVRANTNVNVRTTAAGTLAGSRLTGDLGRVVGGPVTAALPGGSPLVWWRVDWASGVDGWSFEGGLDQRTLSAGIDVSNWQGDVDWARVAGEGGRVFAIVKATEGTSFVDAKFTRNMGLGRGSGLLMGAYHFARPAAVPSLAADALAEARHFAKTLHPWLDDGGLWPVLDLEDGSTLGKSALSSWCRVFLGEVKRLTTSDSIIYTGRSYAQNYLEDDLAVYPLWIAVPDTNPGANTFDLGPWSCWTIQQYSWTGHVPGITGDVDLNVFSGDPGQLQKYVLPPLTHPLASPRATPSVAVRGTSIELSVDVLSSRARSLMLGATIYPAGLATGGTSDPPRDLAISVPEGSSTVRRSFVLPAGLAPGDYDLEMALWIDLDASGTINAGDLPVGGSRRTASALRVEAAPGFATWMAAAGLAGPAAAPEADPDADGWSNLVEYAFGTEPSAAQAPSPMSLDLESPAGNPSTRMLRLRFPRWADRTDLVYAVQQTTHPSPENWTTLATAAGGQPFAHPRISESGTNPVRVTVEGPVDPSTPSFLRVQIRKP